jgi:uncharacterized protein
MTIARAKLDKRMNHGGKIVGRTKLQKTVYLLALAGFEEPVSLRLQTLWPFSEDLAETVDLASAFGVDA